nr:putative ribonuclease H-like domain-containing protein [Tanacetum cinerariifolium]
MQEELLQFKLQKVWVLVDLPKGKRAIGSKWVFRNKQDKRGTVIRNKARLLAQGHTQEEGIDYDEVFAPVARIEAIRLFLAYASFMGFMVYQMDVKIDFLYETIEEEVYVCQPPGFEDPDYPNKVYNVVKALYGLHQAPRAWYETLENYLLEDVFDEEEVALDAESQGKTNLKDDIKELFDQENMNAASKVVSAVIAPELVSTAEPTVQDKDVQKTKKKRVTDEILLQESFKKLRAAKVSGSKSTQEIPTNDPKEITEEDVQNMLEIVPVPEFKVEALQVKYHIIDWEFHTEDMLKGFDKEYLVALWNLVKERFSSAEPIEDKERDLWVELTNAI